MKYETSQDPRLHTFHSARTGEELRPATPAEVEAYREMIADDTAHTGAVDGEVFGFDEIVWIDGPA